MSINTLHKGDVDDDDNNNNVLDLRSFNEDALLLSLLLFLCCSLSTHKTRPPAYSAKTVQ